MLMFFYFEQFLYYLQSYYLCGKMCMLQEVLECVLNLLQVVCDFGFIIVCFEDYGIVLFIVVYGELYLCFLQDVYVDWQCLFEDWGDEVMFNIFVCEFNVLCGVLVQVVCYLVDGSCLVGKNIW